MNGYWLILFKWLSIISKQLAAIARDDEVLIAEIAAQKAEIEDDLAKILADLEQQPPADITNIVLTAGSPTKQEIR